MTLFIDVANTFIAIDKWFVDIDDSGLKINFAPHSFFLSAEYSWIWRETQYIIKEYNQTILYAELFAWMAEEILDIPYILLSAQ